MIGFVLCLFGRHEWRTYPRTHVAVCKRCADVRWEAK